tara:strand:- start:729 stop:1040 length:312 start_codon:yes stop_codon:yes gene_type:complete
MKKFHKKKLIRFKKDEINKIMEIYSKKISIGEWKDYSISFKNNYAIFSIHKSYKFGPTFEIKKNFSRENFYTLTSQNNVVLASSSNLENVINYLKKPDLRLIK